MGALASFLIVAPSICGPLWGSLLDHVGVQRWIRAIAASSMVILIVSGVFLMVFPPHHDDVWPLLAVLFVYGVASSALEPGPIAAIPRLANDSDTLPKLTSIVQAISQSSRVLTPLFGAGLLQLLGGQWVIVLTGVIFGMSSVLFSVPEYSSSHGALEDELELTTLNSWRNGWRVITRDRDLRVTVSSAAVLMGVVGMAEAATLGLLVSVLKLSPGWLSVFLTGQAISLLIGLFFGARMMAKRSGASIQRLGLAFIVAGLVVALPGVLWLACLMPVLTGAGFGIFLVSYGVQLQLHSPDQFRGLVSGSSSASIAILQAVGIGAGAMLLGPLSPRGLLVVMAFAVVLLIVWISSLKGLPRISVRS